MLMPILMMIFFSFFFFQNILEKFNPGTRQMINAGKAYLKALHGMYVYFPPQNNGLIHLLTADIRFVLMW